MQLWERTFRIPCSPPWRAVREQARQGGFYYWLAPMPINESKPPHKMGQTFETREFKHMFIFQIGAQGAPSGLSFRSASKELETEKIYNRFEDSNMSNM